MGGAVAEHAAVERLPVGRHHPLVRLRGRAPAGGGGGGRRRRRGGRGVTGRARGALIVDDVGREPHPLLRLAAAAALRPAPSPSLLCKLKKKKKRRVRNLAPNPPHERAVAASPSIAGLVSYAVPEEERQGRRAAWSAGSAAAWAAWARQSEKMTREPENATAVAAASAREPPIDDDDEDDDEDMAYSSSW